MSLATQTFVTTVLIQILSNVVAQYLPQMSFPMQMGPQVGMGGPMPIGHPMPMPMPMPISMPMQQPKLPVVVMPFHSKKADKKNQKHHHKKKKKRRPKKIDMESCSSNESDDDSSSSSSDVDYRRRTQSVKSSKKRRQVLTPVISYVTKDGYVVYQKKIKKEKARDWLELGRNKETEDVESAEHLPAPVDSEETMIREFRQKLKQAKKRRNG